MTDHRDPDVPLPPELAPVLTRLPDELLADSDNVTRRTIARFLHDAETGSTHAVLEGVLAIAGWSLARASRAGHDIDFDRLSKLYLQAVDRIGDRLGRPPEEAFARDFLRRVALSSADALADAQASGAVSAETVEAIRERIYEDGRALLAEWEPRS